jgi:class 3 adenylate cyclase
MAVDVVGYSRLIGADEAGTLARVKAHRIELAEPLIAEHHGRVVKLTGDGALVEFASAVDAVECAVAIQAGMAEREAAELEEWRIRYRIGINIGDIILEDADIFGDGVNVAARLEGLAEPGGICVARNVYDQVKSKLDLAFEPMGEHWVKNIAEPITVFRVNLDAPGRTLDRLPVWAQRRWQAAAAAVVVTLAAGAAGAWYGLWPPAPAPETPTAADAPTEEKPALPPGQAVDRRATVQQPERRCRATALRRRVHGGHHYRPRPISRPVRDLQQFVVQIQGAGGRYQTSRTRAWSSFHP